MHHVPYQNTAETERLKLEIRNKELELEMMREKNKLIAVKSNGIKQIPVR